MADVPIGALVAALIFLILISAFFSAAEIGMMALNRYRLRHLAKTGHRGARIAAHLLARPDRLLGVILLGNNAANLLASAVATLIALEVYGQSAVAAASVLLIVVVLIFAEVAPKTLAARHPERVAFSVAYVLRPLLKLLYPAVWLINVLANWLLRLLGVRVSVQAATLSGEELRSLVLETGTLIPKSHQAMLLGILDLEKITVDDVMVPRGRVEGIDLDADWDEIVDSIGHSRFTRLPVYRGTLDNCVGIVHLRKVLNMMQANKLDRAAFESIMVEPYFIPSGTPLTTQLLNFKETKRRIGLVVDEYGDLLGLVTLDEILEEIVGDFTSRALGAMDEIQPEADGSYLIKGGTAIRDLNRRLGWTLPTDGSRTINGLITEYLEEIPEPGTSLILNGYLVEILRTRGTAVEVARIRPHETPPAREASGERK